MRQECCLELFGNEVYLNGIELGTYTAVTPGDVIRTKERSGATLQFPHSIAMITPDSVVRVENQSLVLDVGTITLTTGEDVKGVVADIRIGAPGTPKIAVQARDLLVTPASKEFTAFEVTRSNGLIAVKAGKISLVISCGSRNMRLEQGHSMSPVDKSGCGFVSQ